MFFPYKNSNIYFSDSGNGKVIVLLHGYLESSDVWAGFEKALSANFRVISVDLPGHGKSEVAGTVHSMEFLASVIRGLLDNLGIKKVFLTGHSLGGYVTLAFLEMFPEYLSGYCLFHSHPFSDTPEIIEKRMKEIDIVKTGNKEFLFSNNIMKMFATANLLKFDVVREKLLNDLAEFPCEGIIALLNGMMARPSRLSIMESGKKPCLWILGAMDNHIQYDIIQTRVKLPSNARVEILKNSGHLGFIEEEERSAELITEFISGLDDK